MQKRKLLLAPIILVLLISIQSSSAVITVNANPQGTLSFSKDGEGPLLRWEATTNLKFQSWSINSERLKPTLSTSCSLDEINNGLNTPLNSSSSTDVLKDKIEISVRAEQLFKIEITKMELNDAWNDDTNVFEGTVNGYLCYIVTLDLRDDFTGLTTDPFIIKIYEQNAPATSGVSSISTKTLLIALGVIAIIGYFVFFRKK